MTCLYDVRYSVPRYSGVQMAGAFTYEGQVWPAGSWVLLPAAHCSDRRKVVTDAQFVELERVYGAAAILMTHPTSAGGSPTTENPKSREGQKKYRHRKELERRIAREQSRRL